MSRASNADGDSMSRLSITPKTEIGNRGRTAAVGLKRR
jgi:hypothetical protein